MIRWDKVFKNGPSKICGGQTLLIVMNVLIDIFSNVILYAEVARLLRFI